MLLSYTELEVEALIESRLSGTTKQPGLPAKLPYTGQTLGFNMTMDLKIDGLIDGLERYGYRIIKIRDDAGILK